jgi:hypothetical protein
MGKPKAFTCSRFKITLGLGEVGCKVCEGEDGEHSPGLPDNIRL